MMYHEYKITTMNKNNILILIAVILFASCSDLIDPVDENIRDRSLSYKEANFGYNLLSNAYVKMPANSWSFNDVATDDAVSNDNTNGYLKLATGQWTAYNNAADRWTSCYNAIQYVNIFLSEVQKMTFSEDKQTDKMFKDRMEGEAYGLRAIFYYNLLQAHAGWVNGSLKGVPIILTEQTPASEFNLPRASFNDCVKQIYKDIDSAEVRLPLEYNELTSISGVPAKYVNAGVSDYGKYNRVFGMKFRGLVNGLIVKAIRSEIALMAASPAFATTSSDGSTSTWEDAALYASAVVKYKSATGTLPATSFASGVYWYRNSTEISAITNGSNPPEILWRGGTESTNSLEANNYPPSLFGSGRVNPTQNLVDAFPDKNGYPITASSIYVSTNPYANRDPRLKEFILVHGEKAGVPNTAIDMTTGQDAVNAKETSTRTGYYMRKLLRQDVNYNPTGRNTQTHYKPRIRFTEIYLNFAEAANEAWGPMADPKGLGFTAYSVVKAIRLRAGLTPVATGQGDAYLESIKNDPIAMRQLIRNERRLELCFEGFRFWDLRRWKVSLDELKAPAKGITVSGSLATPVFSSPVTVENRLFQEWMYFGPIPYTETLKWSNLLQNDNWK